MAGKIREPVALHRKSRLRGKRAEMILGPDQPPPRRWVAIAKAAGILVGGSLVMVLLGLVISSWFISARYGANEDSAPSPDAGRNALPLPPAVYEKPAPTAEQSTAISGGKPALWTQQGMAWTLPQQWARVSEDQSSCGFQSDDASGGAMLAGTVSPVTYGAAVESSLEAYYAQSVPKQKSGAYAELRYLELDGVKGVMWREAAPSNAGSLQRLQWTGYRTYRKQQQLISVVLACRAGDFARYEPLLYGILYSTRIPQEVS
jgi:hypothetical protein